ncbi:MAG: cache domain-containing protein [Methanotrichaceae archaeon]|nr:cache domain-containing protein [Methanotrichaceae archaeon]
MYAYDFNGTCLAHPFKSDWIGENKLNETDSNGVLYIRDLINVAREEKGFTYSIFPNPAHDNRDEIKLGYVMKVDNNWWLGSGLYLSDINASFDQEARDELVAYVNEALQFAKESGKQESLEVFNDPGGNFTRDGRHIFAYDYEGITLALPPAGADRHKPNRRSRSRRSRLLCSSSSMWPEWGMGSSIISTLTHPIT